MTRAVTTGRAVRVNRESASGASKGPAISLSGYFRKSELPLHSLIFLLPLMALFEVGTRFHPADPIAFRLLQLFFAQLGATGRYLPAMLLVGILLCWHLARRDGWSVKLETLAAMALESWALSLPLLVLGMGFSRWNIHVPLYANGDAWRDDTVLSLGAGIYEELVFRLILMTLLMLILADFLKLKKTTSGLLMVLISAVLFSLYHYLGNEAFQWRSFVFRTVAGVYFAGIFLTRGFGITAGCHIAYDILIVALQALALS
jgi:membrane protease YdiL (CAAX protease family)